MILNSEKQVMKRIFLALALSTLFVVLLSSTATAEVKIGTVDSKVIVDAMDDFKQIKEQVSTLQRRFNDTLLALKNRFDEAFKGYQANQATLDQAKRQEVEGQLKTMQNQFQEYQQTRFGQGGYLAAYQNQLQAPITAKVLDAIKVVAKKLGLTVVMEESAMLYVDPDYDITFKVLEYLKKQG